MKFSDAGIQDISTRISINDDLTERCESDDDDEDETDENESGDDDESDEGESDEHLEARDHKYLCLISLNSERICVTSIAILIIVHLGILIRFISPPLPLECRSQFDSHACITRIEPRILHLIKDSQKPIHLKWLPWTIDVIPIHCDCNVKALQIVNMYHGKNLFSPNIVFICNRPNHLYGKLLADLSEEELICQDHNSRNAN